MQAPRRLLTVKLACMHALAHNQQINYTHMHDCGIFARFARRSKVIKMEIVVWVSAAIITLLEAFFVHDPLNYPNMPQVSMFRLIVLLIFLGFCWFGTLIADLSWNSAVFSFLLQTVQNGFKKEAPPEVRTFLRNTAEYRIPPSLKCL